MKDLTTYITESRRLKDLKGKRAGKIDVGADEYLKWSEPIARDMSATVEVTNLLMVNDDDLAEMYKHFEHEEYLSIWIEDNLVGMGRGACITLEMTNTGDIKVSVNYLNGNKYDEDPFAENEREFIKRIKEIFNYLSKGKYRK